MRIISHHRSLALAERAAADKGMVIVERRRADGRYSTRGHTFVFEDKLMWRYTVAYAGKGVPVKKKYHRITWMTWARSRADLKVKETRELFMASLPGRTYPWEDRWFPVNEEFEQVEFDASLEGKIERTQ